jgi:hypothetical protein
VGLSYSQSFQATGGSAPYTWDVTAGTLPGGISLSTAGVLSGTPTASGTFNFTVRARDSVLSPGTRPMTLIVDPSGSPGGPVVVNTSTLPNGVVGLAYSQGLSATGGQPPYTWAITAGTLPAGLNLGANGVISGTPTAAVVASFTVRATDSAASPQQGSAALMLTIDVSSGSLAVLTTNLAGATQGEAYSETLYAANGTPPYTWDVTAGVLPGGLSLNPATGVISGTPTQRGSFAFNVTVTDSTMASASMGLTLNVSRAPSVDGGELSCTAGEQLAPSWLVLFAVLAVFALRRKLDVHGNR